MSGFDTFVADVMAMEGMISKIKNRKVHQVDRSWVDKLEKFTSIDAIIEKAKTSEKREYRGLYEGKNVDIDIHGDGEVDASASRIVKSAFSSIGKVQNLLAEKIVKSYNESNGKNGPWEWTENGEFHQRKASDVSSKIKLETFAAYIDTTKNSIKFELYFEDGELWWGHVIVVVDAFDKSGHVAPDSLDYSIEG